MLCIRERDVKIQWQQEWFAEEEKWEQMTFAMCRNAGFCNHTQLQKDLSKRTHSMMLMIHIQHDLVYAWRFKDKCNPHGFYVHIRYTNRNMYGRRNRRFLGRRKEICTLCNFDDDSLFLSHFAFCFKAHT